MPESYLNYIQLAFGIAAAVLIFIGIFISCKKLNPEKYETIPMKTTVISVCLILLGLLCYTATKTCTNMTLVTEEHYDLWALYFATLGEVFKLFGFVALIPILFRLFKPKTNKPMQEEVLDDDEAMDDEEDSEDFDEE